MADLALNKFGSTGTAVSLGLGTGDALGAAVSSTAEAGDVSEMTSAAIANELNKGRLNTDITLKNRVRLP